MAWRDGYLAAINMPSRNNPWIEITPEHAVWSAGYKYGKEFTL